MKNKKMWLGMFAIVIFGLAIGGCASSPVGADYLPNNSQAVVTVVREPNVGAPGSQGAAAKWVIMIDGVEAGKVGNKGTTKVLVDNGQHSIQIVWMNIKSDTVEFTAGSNELIFGTRAVWKDISLPVLELGSR